MAEISAVTLQDWSDIHAFARPNWIFRGQRAATWKLRTSLERCCEREDVALSDLPRLENELLRDFQRAYHHYSPHVPAPTAILEWLSLMQHHGAPTRMLDFTYSAYVAAYFAIETAVEDSAIWAVNAPWALQASVEEFVASGKGVEAKKLQAPTTEVHERASLALFFSGNPVRIVTPLSPFRLNERLRTQKGTFLVPGDPSSGFMANLTSTGGSESAENVVKIVIPIALRREMLAGLDRMNISRRSLFPGIDGYAQSLGIYHPSFRPDPWD